MIVLDPGHKYALRQLDGDGHEVLTYVKREGPKYPGNIGRHPGTNLQEELRAQIHRVQYLDKQNPHWRNAAVLGHLRESLINLEYRAAEQHGRVLLLQRDIQIENFPTCIHCGHIKCYGVCQED